jgi:inositol phosphorylceramide mannosyltransferase catalytic subunit
MNNLFIYIFIILLVLFICKCSIENFYDFENVPKSYGDAIKNINDVNEKGVPKIIHHICPRDFNRWHPKWFVGYESWLRIFPKEEYKHMIWYDDELHKIIEEDFPWFLETFKSYDKNIKRIDMVRPFILYKYGGIYADMDFVVYKNFYDKLPEDKVSICESPYKQNEEITNALMGSPPKHNFWLLVIDECYKHVNDSNVLLSTGPQLISKIYKAHPTLVHVLPEKLYNPFPWVKDTDETIARHYNTVAW